MRYFVFPLLLLLILLGAPSVVRAVGIDIGPIVAKLVEQLTEMAKQLDEFKKISTATQENIDAIGKVGQIKLTTFNASKLASQMRQDAQCLIPDLSKLMPNVEFEDMNFDSVCGAGQAYKETLWLDPKKVKKMSGEERLKKITQIEARRENILVDAATKGLAQADTYITEFEITSKAVDDVAAAAQSATNQNERLAAIAQGQVVTARATLQQTQILAQMLKIQSALAIKAGVPVDGLTPKKSVKKANNSGGGQ